MEENTAPEQIVFIFGRKEMEEIIRSLERTIRNATEEQGQYYDEYEEYYGEAAREKLEEELVSGR